MAERDAEGVLARWARRKTAARRGAPEPEPDAPENERPGSNTGQPEQPPAAPPALARDPIADLPDPDTLKASSDFKVFMQKGVPPDLRRRALRRLWRLDPAYSHHDGLDDCCGDFTDQARVVRGLRTAYRVGRGFLQELETADKVAPPGAEPAREASAGMATAAARADAAAEEPPSAALPSVESGAPAGDGGGDAQASREREPRRPRTLPRRT